MKRWLAIACVFLPGLALAQDSEDDDNIPAAPVRPLPQQPQPQQPYGQPGAQNPYPQTYPNQPGYPQPNQPGYQPNSYPYRQPPSGQPQYDPYGRPIPATQQYPQYQYPYRPQTQPGQPGQPQYQNPYGRPAQPWTPPGQQPAATAPRPPTPAPGITAVEPLVPTGMQLMITTESVPARAAALACADALDNFHLDTARAKCTEALGLDGNIALAHLWLSQAASSPADAHTELDRAAQAKASPAEKLLVEGWMAWREARIADAERAYDELVRQLGGEKRAWVARGQFRQVAHGDAQGAIADYQRAIALDGKYAAAQNFLGFALADAGRYDEAMAALRKYAELAPSEPNAHDSLATLALRRGDLDGAIAEEKQALNLDPKFLAAHATLGDALVLQGKGTAARKEYDFLANSTDGAIHHDGAMREARSLFFDDQGAQAEVALIKEAAWARKSGRPVDAAEAFIEAARAQIERGAVAEAGRGIREAMDSLKPPKVVAKAGEAVTATGPALVDELDRRRINAMIVEARALVLGAVEERALAEQRVDELLLDLRELGDKTAEARGKVLRGWIATRAGDDAAGVAGLERAALPTMRYAYALALKRSGDDSRARAVMEELSRRSATDIETALVRPRAAAWLRQNAATAPTTLTPAK